MMIQMRKGFERLRCTWRGRRLVTGLVQDAGSEPRIGSSSSTMRTRYAMTYAAAHLDTRRQVIELGLNRGFAPLP